MIRDRSSARLGTLALLALIGIASGCSVRHLASPASGCYVGPDQDKLELSSDGHIIFNGTAAGSYDVVAPADGKSGYVIAAKGLTLSRKANSVLARAGDGEFLWPADREKVQVTFGPSSEITFRKLSGGRC